jgi:hypothetical protein
MSTKINPPAFSKDKSYERYCQELLCWRTVTDLAKTKQGTAVALSLPEDHESKICDKVFDQMGIDILNKDDGLEKLMTFMDGRFCRCI